MPVTPSPREEPDPSADAWWQATGADPADHELAGGVPATAPDDAANDAANDASATLERPARPVRAPRAPAPDALGAARAAAGAAVAVAGVALGIGTLLWVSGDPSDQPGPALQSGAAGPVVTSPAAEPEAVVPTAAPPVTAATTAAATSPPPATVAAAPAPPPLPPAPPAPPAPRAAAPTRSLVVPVTVLNNSRREGLAARAAERFEAGGWPVRETGSLRGRIRATTVYYGPGQEASARAFAKAFPGIERVLPRIEGLPGSGLTVVLTRDFPA